MRNPWEVFTRGSRSVGGSTARARSNNKTRASTFSWARMRRRRHWSILFPPRLEASGRAGDRQLQEGRHVQGRGADGRCRKRIAISLRASASCEATLSSRATSRRARSVWGRYLRMPKLKEKRHEVKSPYQPPAVTFTTLIKRSELAREPAPDHAPSFSPSAKMVDARYPVSTRSPARCMSRSRRSKSPRKRKPSRNLLPPILERRWRYSRHRSKNPRQGKDLSFWVVTHSGPVSTRALLLVALGRPTY